MSDDTVTNDRPSETETRQRDAAGLAAVLAKAVLKFARVTGIAVTTGNARHAVRQTIATITNAAVAMGFAAETFEMAHYQLPFQPDVWFEPDAGDGKVLIISVRDEPNTALAIVMKAAQDFFQGKLVICVVRTQPLDLDIQGVFTDTLGISARQVEFIELPY